MFIKSIVIEGVGGDIDISRTTTGAHAMLGHVCIAHINRDDATKVKYDQARLVTMAIYGKNKGGKIAATNSMLLDVMSEMERVAGC